MLEEMVARELETVKRRPFVPVMAALFCFTFVNC